MLTMVGEENLSPLWVKRVKDFKVGPSCVLASTALALHEAPDFKSARHNPDINKTFYTVVGYDTPEEMLEYCSDAVLGRIPRIPGAGIWVNSLWDPTYAPPGKHSLCGWFFFPKASTRTRDEWEEIRATYNDLFIEHFEKWAPNMTRRNVIADYFYTPQGITHSRSSLKTLVWINSGRNIPGVTNKAEKFRVLGMVYCCRYRDADGL
jgi:phytoene dehydrogenase-like protein